MGLHRRDVKELNSEAKKHIFVTISVPPKTLLKTV